MPNNPVQIILNDQSFLRAPEPGKSGPNRDFFEDSDQAFQKHKEKLVASIDRAETAIIKNGHKSAYIKVKMHEDSLAKSYRPNQALFEKNQFPCVGADTIGTLYFYISLRNFPVLRHRILQAENTVRIFTPKKTNNPYKAPSRARLEVGAIQSIEIPSPVDKRTFSVMAAIQAFHDPKTISGYLIDLFETPVTLDIVDDELRQNLKSILLTLGNGAITMPLQQSGTAPVLELQLTRNDHEAIAFLGNTDTKILPQSFIPQTPLIDVDPDRHEHALVALAHHPLVRRIHLPMQLNLTDQKTLADENKSQSKIHKIEIPNPKTETRYPAVGVIDSGIGSILDPWVIDRFDYLSQSECNVDHGTKVAGLLTAGQKINNPGIIPEFDGCKIYDIPLYPKEHLFWRKYQNGFSDFIREMEQAIVEARSKGVRIFNLSINAVSDVEYYGPYAEQLDAIADEYDVLIINSSGNLKADQAREAWPKRPRNALNYLAARVETDTIKEPAESVRSITVGALNPPDTNELAGAPTRYTTRGPGLRVGVKPDVATYGGTMDESSGLFSIGSNGCQEPVTGTSFAAPLVTRILANLDVATQNKLSLECLRAMLLHHTCMPTPLQSRLKAFRQIARQFAGFGQPFASNHMLETDDHQITMVFQSRLTIGQAKPSILRFDFSWPRSLVDQYGRCSGRARMTLVYAPPLNSAFGDEFVRVNLDAKLSQRQSKITRKDGNPSYVNQIKPLHNWGTKEKALIEHGLKWWPVKKYESIFTFRGETSNWRLQIESLIRAEDTFPNDGVPFALILTIDDPENLRPIFNEMCQLLAASGAIFHDIRTNIRLHN
ncbi:MAG: S8 family peptidase [Aestuariivita sp.]|nr:S8 family peptidase [Aestuariivita sp.]